MPILRAYKPIFTFNEKKRPLPVTWDCIFELETTNAQVLSRFVTSIKNEWRKEGFVALEFNGNKEEYRRVPCDPDSWKVPSGKAGNMFPRLLQTLKRSHFRSRSVCSMRKCDRREVRDFGFEFFSSSEYAA